MGERILPTADIVFQSIFGSKDSIPVLKDFLSVVQQDSGYPALRDVAISSPFNLKDSARAKLSIVDVRAVDETGTKYNIEVQIRFHLGFVERTLYYWARSYVEQVVEGDVYSTLLPVVGVTVTDFVLFADIDRAHTCYELRERDEPSLLLTDECILHYLEVPKVSVQPESRVEEWLYFLRHAPDEEDEQMKTLLKRNPAISEAMERYKYFTADEEARMAYESRMKAIRDQANFEALARQEGREEGRKEGREEVRRATAGRLKAAGVDPRVIAEATGLSLEDLAGL